MRVLLAAAALWSSVSVAQTAGQPSPAPTPADAPVAAAPAPAPMTPPPPAASAKANEPEITHWGVNLDVGVPDGIALGAMYRPWYWLRVGAAASYNVLGFGVRGSVSLVPFRFVISPSLNVDVGHYFQGDISSIIKASGLPFDPNQLGAAKNVAYDYVNAHLGIEVGSPEHFVFFLRVGASYLQATVNNLEALLNDPSLEAAPAVIKGIAPSLKLGVVAFF